MRDCGALIGLALRPARLAPMEVLTHGEITLEAGLVGDHKGLKFKKRAITVLAVEDWRLALLALPPVEEGLNSDAQTLAWTVRRANLLVEGVDLPKAVGGQLRVGLDVLLEVTYPCQPCHRMEKARHGLLKALHPDWRGGIVVKVLSGGSIKVGDRTEVVARPPTRPRRRLP